MTLFRPEGTFYGWIDVSASGLTGNDFAHRLLNDAGVAVLPGESFGHGAADHVRISFANSSSEVTSGIERLLDLPTQRREEK